MSKKNRKGPNSIEPIRVLTIRIPETLHSMVQEICIQNNISMNLWCMELVAKGCGYDSLEHFLKELEVILEAKEK